VGDMLAALVHMCFYALRLLQAPASELNTNTQQVRQMHRYTLSIKYWVTLVPGTILYCLGLKYCAGPSFA